MTVWILWNTDGDSVCGIYDSPEKAQEAALAEQLVSAQDYMVAENNYLKEFLSDFPELKDDDEYKDITLEEAKEIFPCGHISMYRVL